MQWMTMGDLCVSLCPGGTPQCFAGAAFCPLNHFGFVRTVCRISLHMHRQTEPGITSALWHAHRAVEDLESGFPMP